MIKKLWAKKQAFIASEEGATAIEYGLIAAGIAVAIATVVFALGDTLEALFTDVSDRIGGAG